MADDKPVTEVTYQLEGWELFWAPLELTSPEAGARGLLAAECDRARKNWSLEGLASQPAIAAVRGLFRQAGCDPTRYRPSSEALLRRVLKGGDPQSIHPLVDLNNCLSLRLGVPACVMAEGSFEGPFLLRGGGADESYESLKGPFSLAGKPVLADTLGPCDTPITGSRRVMIQPATRSAALVVYLPAGVVSRADAAAALEALVGQAPGVVAPQRLDP